jgi:iron complex outermembrane recepter protein
MREGGRLGQESLRRCFAPFAVSAALSLCALGAPAQTQPAAAQPSVELEEVIVTGSRIAAPNEVSTSPIQVVTAKEIQQGGKTDIIDLLNQLPQNFQNANSDLSNSSTGLNTPGGVTTADLRGLGPQRTLVLVNGRRLGVGDPNTTNPNPAPDLDQIPVALIDRVDVVTGGASSVYGSDAIAGVVNFIMKKNFEGIQIDGQIGEYWHSNHESWTQNLQAAASDTVVSGSVHDGRNKSFDVLLGSNIADGKGNVTGYLTYLHSDPIASSERDFGGCQLNLNKAQTGVTCGGSGNSNLFQTADQSLYTVVGNQFLPWPQAGSVPPALFNSQPYIFMSRENDRYNAGFLAHVDINDYVKPYAEFSFMEDKTTEIIAPSGLFQSNPTDPTGNGNFNINCSNPSLSPQEAAIICTPAQRAYAAANSGLGCIFPTGGALSPNCANINIGRRNIEGGGRVAFWDHTNYRAVGGAQGGFGGAWTYDAYASYYYTTLYNSNSKFLNYDSVDNALQATTGASGAPACISGSPCVPWNIFRQGGVTQAALDYLYSTGTSNGSVTERIAHVDVSADLGKYDIKSPFAIDGIGVNVGAEHRNDRLAFAPDATELSGLLSGLGSSPAIDNGTSVKEEFLEIRAPVVQDRPYAKDMVLDGGFRHSNYNTSGGVNTYKFEVQYAPLADLRLRGGYQKAIRAASVLELYTPQGFGQIASPSVDPCAPTVDPVTGALTPAARSFADCQRTGVTAAEYGNGGLGGVYTGTIKQCVALQCGQVQGGNPLLKPEEAESLTVGLNFAPRFVPNLTVSLDFYRITVKGEVGVVSAPIILQNCLNTGDPTYCSLIVRTSTGSISGSSVATGGYILQTNINVGAVHVKGIDAQAAYKFDLPPRFGSVSFLFAGAALLSNTTTPYPGAHTYDCVGLYGPTCQTVNPRWRHNLRVSWNTPWDVEFSALWRFIGPVTLDGNTNDPTLGNGAFDAFDARMPGMNYLDLSASWQVFRNLQLRAGANNVLDKDPPIVSANVAASGAANSFPTYDQLGRQLYLAFTAKFQ